MTDVELFNYLQNKAHNTHTLFQTEIDVTSACNAKCPFCFQGTHLLSDNEMMSFKRIVTLLDELRELGTYYIGFSGGEPFLRSDFLDILEEAKKRLFKLSIITNGMLLNEDKIKRLAAIGIERVTISFHSCNPDNYCRCFGINDPKMVGRVSNNISALLKNGISTGAAITITDINIRDTKKTTLFLEQLGLSREDINYNMLLEGKSQIKDLLPDHRDIVEIEEYLNTKKLWNRRMLCSAGTISCSIDSKGDVYPCTFFNASAGNINQQSLSEIWNDSHLFTIIRSLKEEMFEKCEKCSIKGRCGLCLATNLNETRNIFLPSQEFCVSRKARMGIVC